MLKKTFRYLSLDDETEDFKKIHTVIENGIIFRGSNLWILVFAIIIASVGLNMNSTAVIIGAMLISPLMGPINGMGYSLATYNFPLFKRALKNFSFAVFSSLVASTCYFLLSPLSTAHSELLARTSPTIYDVLIALFGGFAGMLAITSKQKGNILPGVAIATALMPPLCTAGYGLATAQFEFFFGAFYLFTINTVFIALSAMISSQIMGFPIISVINEVRKKKINRWVYSVIFITVIPSIYFGNTLVQNEKFYKNALAFVKDVDIYEGSYLLKSEIISRNKTIKLIYGGNLLNEESKEKIKKRVNYFALKNAELIIQQGFSLKENNTGLSEMDNLKGEINRLSVLVRDREFHLDSIKKAPMLGKQLLAEAQTLYPQIYAVSYGVSPTYSKENKDGENKSFVVFSVPPRKLKKSEKTKLHKWLKMRLKTDKVILHFNEIAPAKK